MTLKLIDCFSGIGGFSLAAERIVGGFETIQFVECDPYAQKILKKHWPHVPIHDDIRTYKPEPYSARVVCGGFPCTDISIAGKGLGITEETRSGLFFQLMRVIRLVRPDFIVLENVAAILNNGLGIVLGELASARYDCEWCCIPASALGACHRRDRWWLVGKLANTNNYGSPSTKTSESVEKTDGRSKEGKNQACKSQRSSQPTNSRTIQRITESSHSNGKGMERRIEPINQEMQKTRLAWQSDTPHLSPEWRSYVSECVLRRGNDGLRNRMDRLRCLGNSVVPQVAAIPLQRVLNLSQEVLF